MTDTSVIAGPIRADGSIPYELGKPNWVVRTIPNIRSVSSTVTIPANRLIDVLILGDGFQNQAEFEDGLQSWIVAFYQLKVYDIFRGAFRIRALFRESQVRASKNRGSFYAVKITEDDLGVVKGVSEEDIKFRRLVFEDVDSFPNINQRQYPKKDDEDRDLTFGESDNFSIGDWLFGMSRNLIVSMLVRTGKKTNASGETFRLKAPKEDRTVRVALGAFSIHEFSHAFGLLSDEYIEQRNSQSNRRNPERKNILNLLNLTFDDKYSQVPWFHLSPWGRDRRQASGQNPSPVVGWLWVGGDKHLGVWHSEYKCLMNGKHDNFKFTQDAAQDPTAQPDGTYNDETGENLRERRRFCLWCQELVTMRILERTDQLDESDDPENFVEKGQRWYERWTTELRKNYWELFDVSQQIVDHEAAYAALTPGRNKERLDGSDLYLAYREDAPTRSGSSSFDDGEWLISLC